MNKADSRRLEEIFVSAGYSVSDNIKESDVVIYNTCSVRKHAEDKAMSHIGSLKKYKQKNPDMRIIVAGCMAQRMKKDILDRMPHVDIVIGPSTMFRLAELIENEDYGLFEDSENTVKEFSEYLSDISSNERDYTGYVPVMKGCDNFCAYCIVPFVRGREQYRPVEDILDECRRLSEKGIREIMLLGQTVNSHPEFKTILRKVSGIDSLKRIRFVTSYPAYMDEELVDIIAGRENLCNYFHIPVQSGSDNVLKKMRRKYTVGYFRKIALYIREKLPDASLTTDLIVGFPGEEEEDLIKTLELVKQLQFDQCFTFKYSPRPGTAASELEDTVSEYEKKNRLKIINRICTEVSLARNMRLVDRLVEVYPETDACGRTDTYKIVCWEGAPDDMNSYYSVKIEEALPHSLKGRIINKT